MKRRIHAQRTLTGRQRRGAEGLKYNSRSSLRPDHWDTLRKLANTLIESSLAREEHSGAELKRKYNAGKLITERTALTKKKKKNQISLLNDPNVKSRDRKNLTKRNAKSTKYNC